MNIEQDLARVALQERRLRFAAMTPQLPWQLGERIRHIAAARGLALAIEVRLARDTVFYYAMPGTTPNNAEWVRRKRNTVELMQQSSYAVGLALEGEGMTLEQKSGAALKDHATHGGSFPLLLDGAGCIGAVTVSGATGREDHAVVVEALAVLLGIAPDQVALD